MEVDAYFRNNFPYQSFDCPKFRDMIADEIMENDVLREKLGVINSNCWRRKLNAEFHIQGKILETERLILRPFSLDDASDIYEYASVEDVGRMAGWKKHESMDESAEILRLFISDDHDFAVCLKDSGKVIGSVGVKKYGREEALTEFDGYLGSELGAALSKDYWGHGLMPEGIAAIIKYLFDELNYDFLLAGYYDFNNRSRRMQEKLGFRPYRKLIFDTRLGTHEPGVLNLLTNPSKDIHMTFSHPETLLIKA